jgi:UDP-4-amino-4,6-dideoxy-N-acetyl-beta-L-altrosamine N-acetyltransferase
MDKQLLKKSYKLDNMEIISYSELSDKEKELILIWRNDDRIRKWSFNNKLISDDEHKCFLNNLKINYNKAYWLVKNNDGTYMGVFNLSEFDSKNNSAYLGTALNPDNLGQGKGKYIMNCIEYIGFKVLKLEKLLLVVLKNNTRAVKFYKNMNYKEIDELNFINHNKSSVYKLIKYNP